MCVCVHACVVCVNVCMHVCSVRACVCISDAPIPLFHYRSDTDTLSHRHFSQETASDLAY